MQTRASSHCFATRLCISILFCLTLVGCATTGPPSVGSSAWHDQRMAEIQEAYDFGEIDRQEYLRLKNEADQIHVDYRGRMRSHHHHSGIIIGGPFFRHRF